MLHPRILLKCCVLQCFMWCESPFLHVITVWSAFFTAFTVKFVWLGCSNGAAKMTFAFRCGFVLQDHDISHLGHLGQFYPSCFHTGTACLRNFPSPLPRNGCMSTSWNLFQLFSCIFLDQLIRNGTVQEAPHPINCTCMYLQVSTVAADGFNKFILQGTLSSPPPQPSILRSINHYVYF